MKNNIQTIALISLLITNINLFADNRIIVYLRHAPADILRAVEQEAKNMGLAQKIEQMDTQPPGMGSQKMVKYALRSHMQPELSGFVAVYAGYMDISNPDGLIAFPLRHATPKIYLAISSGIQLATIKGETFSHREFVLNQPTQVYEFELKKDEKQHSFWDVKEVPAPADKKVNPLSVVILTNPQNIFLPQGQFLSTENVQLILPDIYVIGRANNEAALLHSLDLRRYFEPIVDEEKKSGDTNIQKMLTNI